MLHVDGLARPPALAALGFTLAPGTLAALAGPNGAGKSTLLRGLAGLGAGPGTVTLGGRRPTPDRFAYLPPSREAPFAIASRDVVAMGLSRPDAHAVARALARVDAADLAGRPLTRLSTGERARVLLARALVGAPPLLLLDEPTANLDPAHALLVARLLREEAARGAIVLFASHDLALARAHADEALVLSNGALVAHGAAREVLGGAVLARVFGVVLGPDGFREALSA
ncbi:MAG: ABC transporter ATP-binding protein [Sphingomonadaceae bacterium]|nr:ABC transporter ATP-binding protein [Sphingomonadaceae bacterium]